MPPALLIENIRLAKLILRNVNGEESVQPQSSGWLDSEFTTQSIEMFKRSHGKNAFYAVLTGLQPDNRFLVVIDSDSQELTDWCFANLPETFTVKTRRGAHFYYWVTE